MKLFNQTLVSRTFFDDAIAANNICIYLRRMTWLTKNKRIFAILAYSRQTISGWFTFEQFIESHDGLTLPIKITWVKRMKQSASQGVGRLRHGIPSSAIYSRFQPKNMPLNGFFITNIIAHFHWTPNA